MRTINVRCNWDDLHEVCRDQLLMERELYASTSLLKQINLTESEGDYAHHFKNVPTDYIGRLYRFHITYNTDTCEKAKAASITTSSGRAKTGDIKPEKSSKQTALLNAREEVLDLASIRKPEKQSPVQEEKQTQNVSKEQQKDVAMQIDLEVGTELQQLSGFTTVLFGPYLPMDGAQSIKCVQVGDGKIQH
uniref:Uncharacterized protein n=1 Tax=Wuchereria bancrofti TaxID=6293 RepID=A0A1I8EDY4_WUCBA